MGDLGGRHSYDARSFGDISQPRNVAAGRSCELRGKAGATLFLYADRRACTAVRGGLADVQIFFRIWSIQTGLTNFCLLHAGSCGLGCKRKLLFGQILRQLERILAIMFPRVCGPSCLTLLVPQKHGSVSLHLFNITRNAFCRLLSM